MILNQHPASNTLTCHKSSGLRYIHSIQSDCRPAATARMGSICTTLISASYAHSSCRALPWREASLWMWAYARSSGTVCRVCSTTAAQSLWTPHQSTQIAILAQTTPDSNHVYIEDGSCKSRASETGLNVRGSPAQFPKIGQIPY